MCCKCTCKCVDAMHFMFLMGRYSFHDLYPLCRGGHGVVEWAITADYYIHVQLDGNSLAFRQTALPVGFYTSIAITECC